jgi:hypothetical protein
MLVVAKDLQAQYENALDPHRLAASREPHFRKWLRFYLDFSSKYGHSPGSKCSLPLFHGQARPEETVYGCSSSTHQTMSIQKIKNVDPATWEVSFKKKE